MPDKKSNRPQKPDPHSKPLKIEGSFEELIRQSLQAKKPATGWPKRKKKS